MNGVPDARGWPVKEHVQAAGLAEAGHAAMDEAGPGQRALGGFEFLRAQKNVHVACIADGAFIDA
jgi:hypothetical protein